MTAGHEFRRIGRCTESIKKKMEKAQDGQAAHDLKRRNTGSARLHSSDTGCPESLETEAEDGKAGKKRYKMCGVNEKRVEGDE